MVVAQNPLLLAVTHNYVLISSKKGEEKSIQDNYGVKCVQLYPKHAVFISNVDTTNCGCYQIYL